MIAELSYLHQLLFFGDVVLLEFLRLGSCTANGWSETEVRSPGLNKRLLAQQLAKSQIQGGPCFCPVSEDIPPWDVQSSSPLSPH